MQVADVWDRVQNLVVNGDFRNGIDWVGVYTYQCIVVDGVTYWHMLMGEF